MWHFYVDKRSKSWAVNPRQPFFNKIKLDDRIYFIWTRDPEKGNLFDSDMRMDLTLFQPWYTYTYVAITSYTKTFPCGAIYTSCFFLSHLSDISFNFSF